MSVRPRQLLQNMLGVALLLLLWQLLANRMHSAIVASPWETLQAFYQLGIDGALFAQLRVTTARLLSALGLGGLIGIALGSAAGLNRLLRNLLEPVRWVSMTVPPIIVAVLGMLWFGMGSRQVIFLVTFVITPILYVNTVAGIDAIDAQLLEMGKIYRFSRRQVLTEIFLPGIGSYLIAGLTLATGIGIRAVILAELLGAFEGVGYSFNRAWIYLKTPELFAWILASFVMMGLIEFGLLFPLRRLKI
ncbi:MAG: ABC transporter permease subunit [Chloroflexota bacterium]